MKFIRRAYATWQGTGKEGKGTVSTQSKFLDNLPLTFKSRMENEIGTNPEELIGAAHAGCFSMKLAFVLEEWGYKATSIDTTAKVTFEDGKITTLDLELNANIPNITNEEFQKAALNAKENCPVSQLLKAEITLNAMLST